MILDTVLVSDPSAAIVHFGSRIYQILRYGASTKSARGKIRNLSGHHAFPFLFEVTVVAGPELDMVA